MDLNDPRIAALSPEKRALLERRLKEKPAPADRSSAPQNESKTPLPLSFAQERFWFMTEISGGGTFYNLTSAYRIAGPLNHAALQSGLRHLVQRQESLRTVIQMSPDGPKQTVRAEPEFEFTEIEAASESAARSRIEAEAVRPFDLTRGPLLRATLAGLAAEDHVLALTTHHLASDGWSMEILIRDLAELYNAAAENRPASLPPLRMSYSDFALRQRAELSGEAYNRLAQYWKERLRGDLPLCTFPLDFERPAAHTFEGRKQIHRIPVPLAKRLAELSRAEGVTLFMTLLAGFKLLLQRYTLNDDIICGLALATRPFEEAESVAGCFVNTLALRTDLSGDPSFRELLRRVRETALGAYAHQEMPFDKLVEEVAPPRSPALNPICQTACIMHNREQQIVAFKNLRIERFPVAEAGVGFDLECHFREDGDGIRVMLIYNTALYEDSSIARISGHLRGLFESATTHPDEPISALSFMPKEEENLILIEWTKTATEYPRDKSLAELFEAQAGRTPQSVAVASGGTELTYRELNERANRLAHYLIQAGLKPGELAGIYMERSVELIVATLAILKAGGAYLPLDPSYPADRIRFMIEDAGLRFLLTQDRWRIQCEDWRGGTLRQIIHTDSRAEEFDIFPAANPPPKSSGVSTAYVMYTSGSTGQPKGAVVTQRGVSRLVLNTNYVRFQPGDVIGHISNTSFDAATFEIWGALLNGARLRVIPRDTVLSMADFARVIAGERVGIMFLTAAVFNQFARENPAAFSTMRYLLAGGEALDPPSVREVIEHGKPEHLLNGYGPTENTTFTACHLITEVPANAKSIPIGKPISNTRIHIMDSRLRPVPIGVPGELCIGGDGLAAGYLNRPELTAEKFVEAPREIEPEGRIYKTGDLVRWRADGTIEFIGRMDNQIKLRGFRIELGEIESALSSHEDIAQCAAMLREDAPGDKFIAAYLIPRAGKQIQVNALRAWLKTRLPEYMIPSAFVTLDTFPLNPNGKIDRRKLPAPEQTRAQTEYAAPQNSVEEELQAIWARVLGIPAPGRDDNFFDLGGHSLLVVRLMEGIRKSFGRTLPVSAIFQAATIADQSRLLEESVRTREHPDVIEIQPRGNKPPIFFAHGRGNSPLNLIHLARRLGEDQPIFGLQAPWLEGGRREFAQVEFMADHYIRAMKAFRPEGPYVLAGYCLDGLIAFEMARRMRERGEEIPLLILIETLGNNESFRTLRGFIRLIAGTARLPETAQLRLFLAARQCLLLGGRSLKALRGAASVKGLKLLLSRVRHYPMPVVWRRIRAVKTAPDPHAAGMSKDGKGGRRPRNAAQPPAGATLFRDLWTLHGAYVPEEYGGRVLVARSESGGGFPGTERSHLGWEKVVKGRLDRIEIPGSHWSLLREPNVAVLGAEIEKHLREIL